METPVTDDVNLPVRYANGHFGPGNPGRPVGSYNRASRRAGLAILDHFETIQDKFLEELVDNRYLYICLLSRVLPRKVEIGVSAMEAAIDADATIDAPAGEPAEPANLEALVLSQLASGNGADHR
jgi:hypothetical protein